MIHHEREPRLIYPFNPSVMVICCSLIGSLGCTDVADGTKPRKTTATAASALGALMLKGRDLHPSVETDQLETIANLPTAMSLPKNPHQSSDVKFVEATARGGSQGRLGGEGMQSALYARYITGNSEIGLYGLEAKTVAAADVREQALRDIWAYNASLDRARVHRQGLVLLVLWIWTDGALPDSWDAVKAKVEERMNSLGAQAETTKLSE